MKTLLCRAIGRRYCSLIPVWLLCLVFAPFPSAAAGAQQAAVSAGTELSRGASKGQGPAKPGLSEAGRFQAGQLPQRKPAPAQTEKKESAGAAQSEEEDSVMIDARSDEESSERTSDSEPAAAASGTGEAAARAGIPESYGHLKGTLNDEGRNLLIFENEDGVISFVQVSAGKNAASWKLISRIYRSAD